MSDESVEKSTGRTWAQWVRVLDAARRSSHDRRVVELGETQR